MRDVISVAAIRDRWQGVALTLAIGSATLWLAATGRLVLFIHPRYVVFTVILIVVGMLLALLALAVGGRDDGHAHDEDAARPSSSWALRARRRIAGTLTLVVTVAIAAAIVILPPATLSSATAATRDVGASTLSLGASGTVATVPDHSTAKYTVLDWATRLRQSTSLGDYAGQAVDVTGFIAPSPSDPSHTFIVTRFVITCCAVDAQPIGLTVYDPGWQTSLKKDEWVSIRGGFAANPSGGASPIIVVPTAVHRVAQPHDPYLS